MSLIKKILMCFVFVSPVAFADDLVALRSLLDPVEDLSGEFTQTIVNKEGELVQKSSGTFSLKRPGYFLWKSAEPFPQTVVGSPTQLWVYDPDLEQATVRENNIHDNNSPVNILTGDVDALKTAFDVAKETAKSTTDFILTPKKLDEANYESVLVRFKGEQLDAIHFTDKLAQTTAVQFAALKQNAKLDKQLFEFVPPPGTDVISDQQ